LLRGADVEKNWQKGGGKLFLCGPRKNLGELLGVLLKPYAKARKRFRAAYRGRPLYWTRNQERGYVPQNLQAGKGGGTRPTISITQKGKGERIYVPSPEPNSKSRSGVYQRGTLKRQGKKIWGRGREKTFGET